MRLARDLRLIVIPKYTTHFSRQREQETPVITKRIKDSSKNGNQFKFALFSILHSFAILIRLILRSNAKP